MGIASRLLPVCCLILLGLGLGLGSVVSVTKAQTGSFTFALVPEQSMSRVARGWGPITEWLGRATGTRFLLRNVSDLGEFERGLAVGEFDFAYMNPYQYVLSSHAAGYRAFAKVAGQRVRGVLIAGTDSPVADPGQIEGRAVAFPAPDTFAASILIQNHLADEGIAFTPEYVGFGDAVYRSVADGVYSAGGGTVAGLKAVEPAVRDRLRVLWTSPAYAPNAIAAHPRVSDDLVERLNLAMAQMSDDPDGRALLAPFGISGFDLAEDSDWNDVRALGIRPPSARGAGGF
jgi:phosphonate transport system substrate-binding protein